MLTSTDPVICVSLVKVTLKSQVKVSFSFTVQPAQHFRFEENWGMLVNKLGRHVLGKHVIT